MVYHGKNPDVDEECVCVIVAEKKEEILKSLEQFSHITGDRLFPDFEGFALDNSHDKPYRFPDYYKLGNQAYQKNQYEDAISHYTTAIRMDPKNESAYVMRAMAKLFLRQFKEAIEELDKGRMQTTQTSLCVVYYANNQPRNCTILNPKSIKGIANESP